MYKNLKTFEQFSHEIEDNWDGISPEVKKESLERIEKEKKDLLERIEYDYKQGKDIEKYIIGYVINIGNEFSPNIESVVFGKVFPTEQKNVSWVLSESVGDSFQWFRYNNNVIRVDTLPYYKKAVDKYRKLQDIKNYNKK